MKKSILYLLFISFIFAGCQKGESPAVPINPVVPSSEKNVSAVVFKASDNPSLATDVIGSFNSDTIKAEFPQTALLTSLVPTITFAGKSINPANQVAQNFSNPISYTVTAEDGSKKSFVFACRIQQVTNDSASILSYKWQLFKDSSTNIGNYYFNSGGGPSYSTPGVYFGIVGDYWEFRSDGSTTINANNQAYNSTYILHPDNKLEVAGLMVHGMATVIKLTDTEAIFDWSNTSPNGGQYFRRTYLKK